LSALKNYWMDFISSIALNNKQLIIILMPQSPLMNDYLTAANIQDLQQDIFHEVTHYSNLKIIDLTKLFEGGESQSCEYYSDFLHYNNKGIQLITEEIMKHLPYLKKDTESASATTTAF